MFKKVGLIILIVFGLCKGFTQDSTGFNVNAFAEVYFNTDNTKQLARQRADWLYNHKHNKAIDVNLAFVKTKYTSTKFRANCAAMLGNYATYNLSAEPEFYKYVLEANAGLCVNKKTGLWLDAGIFPSHIGFESVLSTDCINASRSIVSENSPYFETGVKLSGISKNKKIKFAFLLLTGWQRITVQQNIKQPSLGVQINYMLNENTTITYNNFIGFANSLYPVHLRNYHNLYADFKLGKFEVISSIDVGFDKNDAGKNSVWFSPVIAANFQPSPKYKLNARVEVFNDANETLIKTNPGKGFAVWGLSIGGDVRLSKNILLRAECKNYLSKHLLFDAYTTNQNFNFLSSICISVP